MKEVDTKLPSHQEGEKKINKKEQIKSSADIFNGNPERDAIKLDKVIGYLEKVYGLSRDTLIEVKDTIKEVHKLTEMKGQIPRKEVLEAANNVDYGNEKLEKVV